LTNKWKNEENGDRMKVLWSVGADDVNKKMEGEGLKRGGPMWIF
jgi:hypothetical protein